MVVADRTAAARLSPGDLENESHSNSSVRPLLVMTTYLCGRLTNASNGLKGSATGCLSRLTWQETIKLHEQMKWKLYHRLEKLETVIANGYEDGNIFDRTTSKILASCFRTGEISSCSSKILMVRSNNSRRVLSLTSDDSSGIDEV